MRNQIHQFFFNKSIIITLFILIAIISALVGDVGYLIAIVFALAAFWAGKFNIKEFGFGKHHWGKSILISFGLSIGLLILANIIIEPITMICGSEPDLSSLDAVEGNIGMLIFYLVIIWITAAIGEEFVYRGFFMKRIAEAFGDSNKSWLLSSLFVSIVFGLAHMYQGIAGIIGTAVLSLAFCAIFYYNRKRLIIAVLTHGLYDSYALIAIYYGIDKSLLDMLRELF